MTDKKLTAGFSLVEILFSITIISIIGLAIIQISNISWKSFNYNKQRFNFENNIISIQKINEKLRNALDIKISTNGKGIIIKETSSNNKLKYSRYILDNKNLYLQTQLSKQNNINNINYSNNKSNKVIIGNNVINNQKIFSFTKNKLITIKFNFKKKIALKKNSDLNVQEKLVHTVYPRNMFKHINLKNKVEVK